MTDIKIKKRLSVKAQTIATFLAIAASVIIPQICHVVGKNAGIGNALGELLLPMHLPILLVGLMAGPYAGAVSGALAPLVSFALTGMPSEAVLPFMMIELCVYGLVCGILRSNSLSPFLKVLISQVAGRGARALAVVIAFYGFNGMIAPISVWNGVKAGVIGIILQLALIPLIVFKVENADRKSN